MYTHFINREDHMTDVPLLEISFNHSTAQSCYQIPRKAEEVQRYIQSNKHQTQGAGKIRNPWRDRENMLMMATKCESTKSQGVP